MNIYTSLIIFVFLQMERQQKVTLKELVERHQSEIMALNRAHVEGK